MIDSRHPGPAPDATKKDVDPALTHALTMATQALREAQVDPAHAGPIITMVRLMAAIVPEMTQPITAIVTNAQAAQHFLNRQPLDLKEVRHALDRIVRDAFRASDLIHRIRGFLKEAPQEEASSD